MKSLYITSLILALLSCSLKGFSQNTNLQRRTPQRATETTTDKTSTLTDRARIKNEEASKAPGHVVWLREMYRYIHLEEENNAALYYPVEPIGDRMNLFTTIFKLLADGKITAYNYPFNGREVFTDAEKLDFEKGFLEKLRIPSQKQGSGENIRYIIDDSYIPSSDVLIYQIKESHYFDAATGMYKTQVTAICPVMLRKNYDIGDTTIEPLFWIPYENLRPYLSRTMIMTSDYNNVMTSSIDDFFTKGMYKGEIIKTVNLRDLSLAEQVGEDDPELLSEKLKLAQDSIENQLKVFRNQLWVQPDTTQVANSKNAKKVTAKKEKEEKPKAAKPEKSSAPASPTKSVRRTR